jgi:magnesium transporter
LGATLIAGIYGMNFRHMPELNWTYGYPLALGGMLAVMIVLYVVFKKKGWL